MIYKSTFERINESIYDQFMDSSIVYFSTEIYINMKRSIKKKDEIDERKQYSKVMNIAFF